MKILEIFFEKISQTKFSFSNKNYKSFIDGRKLCAFAKLALWLVKSQVGILTHMKNASDRSLDNSKLYPVAWKYVKSPGEIIGERGGLLPQFVHITLPLILSSINNI